MNVKKFFSRIHLPFESRMAAFDGATGWLNSEPLEPAESGRQGRRRPVLDLHVHQLAPDAAVHPGVGRRPTASTGWSWSACTRPSSASSTTSRTFDAPCSDWGSSTRSRSTTTTACGTRSGTSTGRRSTSRTREGHIRHHHFGEGELREVGERHPAAAGRRRRRRPPERACAGRGARHRGRRGLGQRAIAGDLCRSRAGPTASAPRGCGPRRLRTRTPTPPLLHLNEWAFAGEWTVGREEAVSNAVNGRIAYCFHARDLNLILVPPARARRAVPRAARRRGTRGRARPRRRRSGRGRRSPNRGSTSSFAKRGDITDRQFEIELLDPGAAALCFTFG